jgi:uncharacterized protein with HEPN domain
MSSRVAAIRRSLEDIRYHIVLAQRFTEGMDCDAFHNDLRATYAVTRCLEIISEASRRLPDELKARHPSIAWRDMAAAGNIYRHEYEDVAAQAVWDTLNLHLPPLQQVIDLELARFGNPR